MFLSKTESSVVQLYLIVSDQQSVMNTLKEIKRVTPVVIKDSAEGSDAPSQEEIYTLTQKATFRGDLKSSEGGVPVKNSDPDPTPVSVFDPKAIQEIVKNTVAETVASVKQAMESEKQSALESQKQQFEATKATLEASLNSATEAIQKSNEKIAQLETKITESEKTINNFADLGKLYGSQTPEKMQLPNFNKTVAHDADKITGALQETFDLIEDIQKNSGMIRQSVMGGNQTMDLYNKAPLDRHIRDNRKAVINSLEDWGRKRGWFRGNSAAPVLGESSKNSPTTAADLPPFFLDTLSAIVRTTHISGLTFWQIPTYALDFTARSGTVIRIPRLNYLTSSPAVNDYLLSGKGEYADLTSESDNSSASSVSAEIFEYGRGKVGASTPIRPMAIPSFTEFFSAMPMLEWMQKSLFRDYASFDNTMIKTMLDSTSLHLYNKNGTLVTSPTGLSASGDNGTFTKKFMRKLYQYAHDNLFQMNDDETFFLYLNSTQILQLKESYENERDWQANTKRDLDDLLNILNPSYIPPGDTGRVTGYLGLVEKFHIFETGQSVGTGAAGQPGVQNETLGGSFGSRITRTGYLIGAGALGIGEAMPFEIRQDDVTQFDRRTRMTWLAWRGYKTLDVDPVGTGEPSQQLRVAELRTLDVAV